VDSWGAPTADTQRREEDTGIVTSIEPNLDDDLSDTSTVEINLTTKVDVDGQVGSPDPVFDLSR
jgi:hypothetical protein